MSIINFYGKLVLKVCLFLSGEECLCKISIIYKKIFEKQLDVH
jgi:hypothetical protein